MRESRLAKVEPEAQAVPIPTTTIGACPKPDSVQVPDWFYNPDTANPTAGWAEAVAALGERAEEIFAEGTRSVVEDQVRCGIDIPTDDELRRENYVHFHCRYLEGSDFENLSETGVRGGNYRAWLPTIRGPVAPRGHFLDGDYRIAQSFTDRPVKITLPGPITIADAIEASSINAVSMENAHRGNDPALLERSATTKFILCAVAIAKSQAESVDEVTAPFPAASRHIDGERRIAAPGSGLGLLPQHLALRKLSNPRHAATSS